MKGLTNSMHKTFLIRGYTSNKLMNMRNGLRVMFLMNLILSGYLLTIFVLQNAEGRTGQILDTSNNNLKISMEALADLRL